MYFEELTYDHVWSALFKSQYIILTIFDKEKKKRNGVD